MKEPIETIELSGWNDDNNFLDIMIKIGQWVQDNGNEDVKIAYIDKKSESDQGRVWSIELKLDFYTEEMRNLFKLMFKKEEYEHQIFDSFNIITSYVGLNSINLNEFIRGIIADPSC